MVGRAVTHQAKNLAIMAFCITLCACSTTSETFDCPAGKGVGCQPISAVNRMVDQGAFQGVWGEGVDGTPPALEPPAFAGGVPAADGISVRRAHEEHLKVWIAPFQDAHGNFHEGSFVHTVAKPGSWHVSAPSGLEQEAP